jgi:hypothetical protein
MIFNALIGQVVTRHHFEETSDGGAMNLVTTGGHVRVEWIHGKVTVATIVEHQLMPCPKCVSVTDIVDPKCSGCFGSGQVRR